MRAHCRKTKPHLVCNGEGRTAMLKKASFQISTQLTLPLSPSLLKNGDGSAMRNGHGIIHINFQTRHEGQAIVLLPLPRKTFLPFLTPHNTKLHMKELRMTLHIAAHVHPNHTRFDILFVSVLRPFLLHIDFYETLPCTSVSVTS